MVEEGKVVDANTFNALLTWSNEIDTEAQINGDGSNFVLLNILRVMENRGIRPTTTTFNAVLHAVTDKRLPFRRDAAENAVVEMIDLGLRPNLGTLGFLVKAWRDYAFDSGERPCCI